MSPDRDKLKQDPDAHVYVVIKKKFVFALAIAFFFMFAMTGASIQWANYVDMRSNQRLCGVITLFNKEYAEHPPPTVLGQNIYEEMSKIETTFKCKRK